MISGLDLLFLEVNNLAEPPIASVRSGFLRITVVQQIETMLKRGRGVHFVLGVADVDEFYKTVKTSSIQITEPRDEGWGGRFVSLQDPDGYRFFFVTWK
jgi:uncharacterized glyoxalase superfamily protein PhnB